MSADPEHPSAVIRRARLVRGLLLWPTLWAVLSGRAWSVDPAVDAADWTGWGETTVVGDLFGGSVAGAGDANGDGYPDLVVGSPDEGLATLFLGSSGGFSETATAVFDAGSDFGTAVAGAGDVNGDGYDDVILGGTAFYDDTGTAQVFYGAADSDLSLGATALDGYLDLDLGYVSDAGAGDVDGDGFDDVLVGGNDYRSEWGYSYLYLGSASGVDEGSERGLASGTGCARTFGDVYVYYGSPSGLALGIRLDNSGTTWEGGTHFGEAVAGAGDVNGDGFDDVIVGASGWSGETGLAYLYAGGSAGLSEGAAATLDGESEDSDYGVRVAAAGDVDGDGNADVLVGAVRASTFPGRVYVYAGSADGLGTTDAITLNAVDGTDDGYGAALVGAGDVDGDGYADVLVGASGEHGRAGDVYIYYGSSAGTATTVGTTLTGEGSVFGAVAAGAGDVNGDGYADLIARGHSVTYGAYVVDVFHGAGDGPGDSPDGALIATTSEGFGTALSGAGDVNGDGYAEVIVGVCPDDVTTTAGSAVVYLGSAGGLLGVSAETLPAGTSDEAFGCAVAGGGDLDGDGYDDVLVGASSYDSGAGRVQALPGSTDGVGTDGRYFYGATHDDAYGSAVAIALDVNGDGYDELVVGAPSARSSGCATMYLGDAIFWASGGGVGSGGASETGDGCGEAAWRRTRDEDTGGAGETGEADSAGPGDTGGADSAGGDSGLADSAAPADSTSLSDSSAELPGAGKGGGCTSGKADEATCASAGTDRLGWALLPVLLLVSRRRSGSGGLAVSVREGQLRSGHRGPRRPRWRV